MSQNPSELRYVCSPLIQTYRFVTGSPRFRKRASRLRPRPSACRPGLDFPAPSRGAQRPSHRAHGASSDARRAWFHPRKPGSPTRWTSPSPILKSIVENPESSREIQPLQRRMSRFFSGPITGAILPGTECRGFDPFVGALIPSSADTSMLRCRASTPRYHPPDYPASLAHPDTPGTPPSCN